MAERAGQRPNSRQLRILLLMHDGYTDQQIADELYLGMRTVEREINRLMRMSGSRSRFTLGAAATRLGWLGAATH
ncbi:LuxR C-terminal-related transcriptional regulator [Actinorhabdospora filicis]|nr:LuxR C-terminal-related transcriptional regulator [Actinorhabdospora filicis]